MCRVGGLAAQFGARASRAPTVTASSKEAAKRSSLASKRPQVNLAQLRIVRKLSGLTNAGGSKLLRPLLQKRHTLHACRIFPDICRRRVKCAWSAPIQVRRYEWRTDLVIC